MARMGNRPKSSVNRVAMGMIAVTQSVSGNVSAAKSSVDGSMLVLSFAARSAFAAVAQRVERRPCFVCVRCPMIVDVALVGQYLETLVAVRPGNERKFPFLTARRNVDLTGDPTVALRYSMRFLVDGRS